MERESTHLLAGSDWGLVRKSGMRLGRLLSNEELSAWAKAEAGGYEGRESLPDYRVFSTGALGTFSGPFGSGVRNAPIPKAVIDEDHHETLFKVYMLQPVGELERLAARNADSNTLTLSWPADAIMYYQQREIYQGMALSTAWQTITTTVVAGILEVMRVRVLEFVLEVEKELNIMDHSNDETSVTAPNEKRVKQMFYTTIQGGENFTLGNSGATNQQSVHVQPGDLTGLKERLAKLGITSDLINDLESAITKDVNSTEQPGGSTKGWLGRVMIMLGKGTLKLAGNAAGTIVTAEVRRFLGLPPI